jgi:DNA-binding transcriptional MerR regulator
VYLASSIAATASPAVDTTRLEASLRRTIDDLSSESGVSVRNIRSYQTRGLLPSPQLEKSGGPYVAYYDDTHAERLEMIKRLKSRGFSLESIGQLLTAADTGDGIRDLLGIEASLAAGTVGEKPVRISSSAFRERFPELAADPLLEERAERLGLFVKSGKGYQIQSPALYRIAERLVDAGLPIAPLLDALETLRQHADAAAREIVARMRPHLVDPVLTAALAGHREEETLRAIRELPALGADAMRLVFLEALRANFAREN